MDRIKRSLKNINGRLFLALLIMGLCPTLYTTLRTFFLGQLPGDWSYSIAGQLSWVNLLYEVINEAIVLPLYFFMGQAVSDKKEYSNRIRSGLLVSLGIYTVCSVLVMIFVHPLLRFMAVSPDILSESASYIRIECVANIFGILHSFICVALITIGKDKLVYAITVAKLILSLLLDT
ncbi:MATE family efflux transporter, partial [Ruminococcus sp.]|uniref:MATE family efflux transporter n=1 Tax=Ruminococcus sp. TaxID=41978 RepID=UPI0025CD714C